MALQAVVRLAARKHMAQRGGLRASSRPMPRDGNHITKDQVANTLLARRGENGEKDGEERDEEGDEESEAFAGRKQGVVQVAGTRGPAVVDADIEKLYAQMFARRGENGEKDGEERDEEGDEESEAFAGRKQEKLRALREEKLLEKLVTLREEMEEIHEERNVRDFHAIGFLLCIPFLPIYLIIFGFFYFAAEYHVSEVVMRSWQRRVLPLLADAWHAWHAYGPGDYLADVAGRVGRNVSHYWHKMDAVIDVVVRNGWLCVLALVLVAGAPDEV